MTLTAHSSLPCQSPATTIRRGAAGRYPGLLPVGLVLPGLGARGVSPAGFSGHD